ncbi:MAG: HpsJ family protein [Thermosynechococcaceae cyanobacterium]
MATQGYTDHKALRMIAELHFADMTPKIQPSGSSPFQQRRSIKQGPELQQFYFSLFRSASLFHWIGYGLLLFVGLDLIDIFYPPHFSDPAWQFEVMGQLVERMPVPLLGLLLVFFGERKPRLGWEFPVLGLLSWLTLLFSLVFLLMIPLGIINMVQLDQAMLQRVNWGSSEQMKQISRVEAVVQNSTSTAQMVALARRYNVQELELPPTDAEIANLEPTALKQDFTAALAQRKKGVLDQKEASIERQHNRLLKQVVKWSIGALISSVLMMGIWQTTRWAR